MKATHLRHYFKKLFSFFLKSSSKKTFSILATLAIVLAIPVTILSLGKQQTLFQRAADNPTDIIVAADASYEHGVPGCGDNPTVPPGGVKQYYVWKTSCDQKCDTNADCSQNSTDPNVAQNTSNWCWGFNLGNGHTANRCMMLHSYGGLGGSADRQIHQANGCSTSALTDCILKNRPDIIPYYLKVGLDTTPGGDTGWTGACIQQQKIVTDWKRVDADGYKNVVAQHCQNSNGQPFNDGPDASYNTNIPTGGKNQPVVCCGGNYPSCPNGTCSAYGNVEASVCPSRRSCIANNTYSRSTTASISHSTTTQNAHNVAQIPPATSSVKPTPFMKVNGAILTAPTAQPNRDGYDCTKTCQYAENGSFKNGWCVKSAGDNCGVNINCGFSSVCAGR